MMYSDNSNMEYISSVNKYTIKQIFKDHWTEYLAKHPEVPEYVRNEVKKVLNCRDPEKGGYAKFVCPDHPREYVIVPHSCKSRFCNVCGVWQTNKWINNVTSDFPQTSYWHITFTIPDYLWYFFHYQSNRPLLALLFQASAETVLGWFRRRGLLPAITSVLHTFGKKLNWNTHIHMITTAAGLGYNKKGHPVWQEINYLPEDVLKKRWRAILLSILSQHIDSSFKKMLFKINWYVHLGARLVNPEVTCKYIGRYSKRPVIAESRITDYDGNFVSFFYEDRQELGFKKKEFCRLTWEEFITRLIQHIPQPQFKMIRYYGILANTVRNKYQKIVFKLLNQVKKIADWLRWRARQIKYKKECHPELDSGIDPLVCRICGQELVLKELAFYSSTIGGLWIKTF